MWNLSESELLLTVAELAVAFAGFASLASILRRRLAKDDPRVDAGRLLNMLLVSLSLTLLSLVPFVPMLLEWSTRQVWGASGAVGFAAMSVLSWSALRRAAEMRRYPGFNPAANAINHALFIAAVIGFLLSALGFPRVNPAASYFASIALLLCSCAILFFRVIASLVHPGDPDSA